MYNSNTDGTTDEERISKPNETIFAHVYRVIESFKASQLNTGLTFKDLPAEFKRAYPEVFGRFDDESLGTIVSLVWLYLGGKSSVNDRIIRKWFRDAIGESR